MLLVHIDLVTINNASQAVELLEQQGCQLRSVIRASLIMIHNRSDDKYYVVKDRQTGRFGMWLENYEAKELMLRYIDSIG